MVGARSLHTERQHYIVRRDGSETLYDLDLPHGQYRNVAGEPAYAPRLAELRHALLRRLLELELHAPRTVAY